MDTHPDDDALSEVVGFLLLLAVLVIAISMYQVYSVPAEGRENEIQHMNLVKDHFTDYKITLDSLWINDQAGTTVSTSFDLGSEGSYTKGGGFTMPVLRPVGSSGSISTVGRRETFTISSSSPSSTESLNYTMGAVEFRSGNNYWIDQTYYYQMGGVFLAQEGGSTVRVSPPLSLSYDGNGVVSVDLTLITLSGYQEISGTGPVRIDTYYLEAVPKKSHDLQFLTLSVDAKDEQAAEMWARVFKNAAERGGLPEGRYNISHTENSASIEVNDNGNGNGNGGLRFTLTRAEYDLSIQNVATGMV